MARQVDIEVQISPTGEVTVHVEGIKGKGCLEYMELIQEALGQVKEHKLTSEYYEQDVQVTGQQKVEGRRK